MVCNPHQRRKKASKHEQRECVHVVRDHLHVETIEHVTMRIPSSNPCSSACTHHFRIQTRRYELDDTPVGTLRRECEVIDVTRDGVNLNDLQLTRHTTHRYESRIGIR